MRRHPGGRSQKQIAILPSNKAIEQPVPVKVARLLPAIKEPDAAIVVPSKSDSREPLGRFFHGGDRAQPIRRKQRCCGQQGSIKNLRKQRDAREPAKLSNHEREDHKKRRSLA